MSRVAQQALLAAGDPAPATLSFIGSTNYPSDGQTVTFTGVSIGAAAADRYVFVEIPYYNGTTSNYSIASVTIGGVLAKIHSQKFVPTGATAHGGVALVSALVPTGTTADIVVTFGASGAGFYRPRINVYRVTGLQSDTAVSLVTNTNTSLQNCVTTASVVKGGIAFHACHIFGAGSRTMSGITTDYNVSPLSSTIYIGGGATVSSTGSLSVTIPNTVQSYWAVVMACFR